MSNAPRASVTPGCHSRNASGCRGATTTGSAVNAPFSRSVLAKWRASYSPLMGQQKARRELASPGNERSRVESMRRRHSSSCAAETAVRAAIKFSRCALRQALRSASLKDMLSEFMTLPRWRNLAGAVTLATAAGFAAGAPSDPAVLGAFDAYRAGDALKFARHARGLDESSLLAPWIDYWRLAMRLDDASNSEVREFFAAHPGTYVAELVRGDWLKVLGRRGDWPEFGREAALYPREDPEVRCYAWLSRAQLGDETVYAESRSAWLEPLELPEGCARLADQMFGDARLSTTDIWDRVRVLFERGQIAAAKATLGYLSKQEAPEERLLTEAARQPKRLLERLPRELGSRPTREAVILALLRLARSDPPGAAQALESIAPQLPEADVRYLWGRIAFEGARAH